MAETRAISVFAHAGVEPIELLFERLSLCYRLGAPAATSAATRSLRSAAVTSLQGARIDAIQLVDLAAATARDLDLTIVRE